MKNKPKYNLPQNTAWMLGLAWKYCKSVISICVLIGVVTVVQSLVQLYIAPVILEKVSAGANIAILVRIILIFSLALMLLKWLSTYLDTIRSTGRILIRVRITDRITDKYNYTSYENVLKEDFKKKIAKAIQHTGGNNEASEHIWDNYSLFLSDVLCFVIYIFLLSNLNVLLAVVILITSIISYAVTVRTDSWRFEHRDEENGYTNKMDYLRNFSESPSRAKDIRIFGLQDWISDIYYSVFKLYENFIFRAEKKQLFGNLVDVIMGIMRNVIAYYYLISLALEGKISAPEFLLYFTAVSSFTSYVCGILRDVANMKKENLGLCSIREALEYPEPYRFEGGKEIPACETYEIEFKNVSYRYPGTDKDIIHNLNLHIHKGENLAIVGLNGAGKTTLVRLMCGFLNPTQGTVALNGIDINEFNRQDYYDLFSAVFQDFNILEMTIAENVASDTENIDYEKTAECIKLAGLEEKVNLLTNGLNTHLEKYVWEDGVVFSGGEKQKLMLARALYKGGKLLVLDEPTAALDPLAENDIYMKYKAMTSGKTSVFISHRLASTRFCDRIIFLKDGVIAEEGTHESLIEQNGEYAELFEVQSRYYKEGREF